MKKIKKNIDKKIIKTEIGILLRLKHTNIIRLKEIFESETHLFLILEYVSGGELFDRIVDKGFYSEQDAARCVNQICQAIDYLHENDIVHRDLKPENLLYATKDEEAPLKLADFGLSKMLKHDLTMQTVCGTPGYCAPEVLLGKNYGPEVDMWAVGVITYIMLCGYEPFYSDADDNKEMFRKILKCEFKFDSPWWDEVSINAKDLVMRLIVLEPEKRLTAKQALEHPWVQGKGANILHMENAQVKLREFNARRKLKGGAHAVIAVNELIKKFKVNK
ncbi:calcium/calmodulin-dependent protein kinase type IV-like [Clytia hemisphaerica]|uniref:Protein kinase domain-containing protein n=1 Tax=Clytia hemisphaerica TaxID=252671 RepID=A0A7M5X9U4_9CNID